MKENVSMAKIQLESEKNIDMTYEKEELEKLKQQLIRKDEELKILRQKEKIYSQQLSQGDATIQ